MPFGWQFLLGAKHCIISLPPFFPIKTHGCLRQKSLCEFSENETLLHFAQNFYFLSLSFLPSILFPFTLFPPFSLY